MKIQIFLISILGFVGANFDDFEFPEGLMPPTLNQTLELISIDQNLTYSGSKFTVGVGIGTPPILARFILDTASAWTWVTDTNCYNCPSQVFDSTDSSSFKSTLRMPIMQQYTNSDWVYGDISYETFTYGNYTVPEIPFLLAKEGSFLGTDIEGVFLNGMDAFDGVMGLAFNSLSHGFPTGMDKLYEQHVIKRRLFSIYLGKEGEYLLSNFKFGGHELETYAPGYNFTMMDLNDRESGYWSLELNGITVGDQRVHLITDSAIINTASEELQGPLEEVTALWSIITANHECAIIQSSIFCRCPATFPDIVIEMAGNRFFMTSDDYLKLVDANVCKLQISAMPPQTDRKRFWSLGHSFLTNYYMLFDMENYMVGLAGRTEPGGMGLQLYEICLIAAAGLVAVAILVALLVYCMCLKKREKEKDADSDLTKPLLTPAPASNVAPKSPAIPEPFNI